MVVPHPMNRVVTSLRTKDLVNEIAKDGFDTQEANNTAVAVEDNPDRLKEVCDTSFQTKFESRISADSDMAGSGQGIRAIAEALSHGHLNCGNRNILCGMLGCECPTRDSGEECTCGGNAVVNYESSAVTVK